MILQKAFGYKPLSMFLMALCTSSFEAETPRAIYRLSADIYSELPFQLKCGKVNIFEEIIWKASCFRPERVLSDFF
jgi:hypothetical protein